MKKIVMFLIVAVLMLGVSGQAMAAFNEGDLIRVVFNNTLNGTGNEYATDLGAFSATAPLGSTNTLNGTGTFSLGSVGASSWNQVNVAYFVVDSNGNGGLGAGWTSSNNGAVNLNGFYPFLGQAQNTLTAWQGAAGGATSVTLAQSNANSYWNNINNGALTGDMFQWLKGKGEATLTALGTTGYVDQALYYYGSDPDNAVQGTQIGTLRTFANGSTQILAQPTPIPAAVYLFGSGLLGLVGLRRKMAA